MKRNHKSTYLIIAILCLILLNIGSMAIILGKNIENIKEDRAGFFYRVRTSFNISKLTREVFGNLFIKDSKEIEIINYDELEMIDDFMIINEIEELENLIIVKDSQGKHMVENIPELLKLKKINYNKDKPYIFMYHTHATEAFMPYEGNQHHNPDNNKNMVRVGSTLAKVLEASGHNIIHEKTHHDRPSYNQSYSRSLYTLNKVMEEESNLKIFLDLHRDGIEMDHPNAEKRLEAFKAKINGIDTATFSLVVGPHSDNYDKVLGFAKYIKAVSDILYPDLCTGIIIKKVGKFNQFVSDYTALLEIGSNGNTLDEALECVKLVGEVLDTAIRGISEE